MRLAGVCVQWCGHCKRLAPEYAAAAGVLKEEGIRIGKVDATVHRELAQQYEIQGFPTLKFFRGLSSPAEYNGGRTKDAIVDWVRKRSGPAYTEVSSEADLKAVVGKAGSNSVVFGAFSDRSSSNFAAFARAALSVEGATFAVGPASAAAGSGAAEGSVVLFKEGGETAIFGGDVEDEEALGKWVKFESLALVTPFSSATSDRIFGAGIDTHVLVFADSADPATQGIIDGFKSVAKEFRGRIVGVSVDVSEDRIMQYFEITKAALPTVRLVNMPEGGMKKYLPASANDVSEQGLRSFVQAFFDGKLKPHLKSEKPAADDLTGPVKVIRGVTFQDVVLDSSKDVLLEFYAPVRALLSRGLGGAGGSGWGVVGVVVVGSQSPSPLRSGADTASRWRPRTRSWARRCRLRRATS